MPDAVAQVASFAVDIVDFEAARAGLHAVREQVFIVEQGVPADIERDALDPLCRHVLARDAEGRPIGAGRLTPDHRIGRMAVLAQWRSRGVGEAMLQALVEEACRLGWHEVSLHAQVSALAFYSRHGFIPYGPRFSEAGIDHQSMRRRLDAATPVEGREAAQAALQGVIAGARRQLLIYSRELDPGLLDQSDAVSALRRFATGGGEVRVLLQDPATPQRALAPLLGLGQRLTTAFAFRAIEEPVDRDYPSAYAVNDRGGWYFRALGHRFEGECRMDDPARARQLHAIFDPVWERARPCSEYRALGI
ncbi:GNAT family N-acetyltransferase [Lysobacter niastensis]|uniref:GNAT family N-acetyltransferase n=1 Tax=Lysobacter niastensis TaxID=380629 RepID=A0ABS0BC24_9GAMM|nr:GNAT family N-acetyltransferase [Lysobacter niastensis]MBF6024539.1 GNAT family N-acetyltransferase [Lysobacter niastensis]